MKINKKCRCEQTEAYDSCALHKIVKQPLIFIREFCGFWRIKFMLCFIFIESHAYSITLWFIFMTKLCERYLLSWDINANCTEEFAIKYFMSCSDCVHCNPPNILLSFLMNTEHEHFYVTLERTFQRPMDFKCFNGLCCGELE